MHLCAIIIYLLPKGTIVIVLCVTVYCNCVIVY